MATASSSATSNPFAPKPAFNFQAAFGIKTPAGVAQKAVFLQEEKPVSLKGKATIANPEITAALSQGNLKNAEGWLREKGWQDKELAHLKNALEIAGAVRGIEQAPDALCCELFKQAIAKRDIEVFEAVPKDILANVQDLAEVVDLLTPYPEDPVCRRMLGIVKESAAENKFDLIFNSRPINSGDPLTRRMISAMKLPS